MNPEQIAILLRLLAIAFGVAATFAIAGLLLDLLRRPRVLRLENMRESLRENINGQVRYHVRTLLRRLPMDEFAFYAIGLPQRERITRYESQIPLLRQYYEDMEFLLELQDFLKIPVESISETDQSLFCRARYIAGCVAYVYGNPRRTAERLTQVLQFSDRILKLADVPRPRVLFYLGTSHLTLSGLERNESDLDSAIEYLGKAANLARSSGNAELLKFALYNLAWATDEKGRDTHDSQLFEQAIKTLNEAIQLDPSFSQARHNLASALSMVGKLSEALNVLKSIPAGDIWTKIESDQDFAPIRDHPSLNAEFVRLVEEKKKT